jgi:hypothetical protein
LEVDELTVSILQAVGKVSIQAVEKVSILAVAKVSILAVAKVLILVVAKVLIPLAAVKVSGREERIVQALSRGQWWLLLE